jgi:hypothetical protein
MSLIDALPLIVTTAPFDVRLLGGGGEVPVVEGIIIECDPRLLVNELLLSRSNFSFPGVSKVGNVPKSRE